MGDKPFNLQISNVSSFSNNATYFLYKQKARILALVVLILIIYIAGIWVDRALIHYKKYNGSQYHLILIEALLIFIYGYYVHPYMIKSNNRFSGISEINRQMAITQLEEQIAIAEECNDIECYKALTEKLKLQLQERDAEIANMDCKKSQ